MKLEKTKTNNSTVLFVVFILILAASGTYAVYKTVSTSGAKPLTSGFSIQPSSGSVTQGKLLRLKLWENSNNQPVNAVQANISYEASKLKFVSVDSASSAFNVSAQAVGGGGNVNIARGQVSSIKGKNLVATVIFKSLAGSGRTKVNFASGSAIVRSSDHKNILAKTYAGTYALNP